MRIGSYMLEAIPALTSMKLYIPMEDVGLVRYTNLVFAVFRPNDYFSAPLLWIKSFRSCIKHISFGQKHVLRHAITRHISQQCDIRWDVNNNSSYCSNLYLCSLWANYRKSSISRFNVSYNNAFRILHNLHMRCSASSMFANAVVDSCSTCIGKSIFSLMMRLNTSINEIVQSTLKSDVYTTSELYQRWVKALYT